MCCGCSLPVLPGDPADLIGKVRDGQLFVMIYRTDYWQCAYLIPKGGFDTIKAEGCQIPRPAESRSPALPRAASTRRSRISTRSSC